MTPTVPHVRNGPRGSPRENMNALRILRVTITMNIERIIAMLKEEKKRIDEQIREWINEQKAWQE
jgi:hypothetical protein